MGLLGSLRVGAEALQAQRLAMEVAGNNVANANTPGYARQTAVMNPSAINEIRPGVHLGMGVSIEGIESAIDEFIEQRLRDANSDKANQVVQEQALSRLEGIFNEMTDDDLSTIMTEFFGTIQDVQNRPEDASIRTLVVQQGSMVAGEIRFLRERLDEQRSSANGQISIIGDQINRIAEQLAELNQEIVELEGGGQYSGAAGGLRTERRNLLDELSNLLDVRMIEDDSGSVNVYSGSNYLVFGNNYRQVEEQWGTDEVGDVVNLVFADDESLLEVSGGKLEGYTTVRDTIVKSYIDKLDDLTGALAFEFNKVHSQGQGLVGFTEVTGTYGLADDSVALNDSAAGLPFTPQNGSFNIHVTNVSTGLSETTNIEVDLDGLNGDDTTAAELVAAIDAVSGISASLNLQGQVEIVSDSEDLEFAFGEDTSYALAALGVNTFFTGSDSRSIDVNETLEEQPQLFAAALDSSAGNVDNAIAMVNLQDVPIESLGGVAIPKYWEQVNEELAGETALSRVESQSLDNFYQTIVAEREQYSGVSLDEEAVNMINFQYAFSAASRYITTISQMLDKLIEM